MNDVGHMNFFNIEQCGLYRVGKKEVYGCDTGETFHLISDWVKDRSLSLTIPWDPGSARPNKPKCYCKDIFHDKSSTGDYFLVLWKSDSDSAGTIWGAEETNETGKGEVVKYTNEYKGKKVIWGRPCYYWVIPETNTIVSIKFEHSVCDAQLFEDFVKACINNRVQHKHRKKEHTDNGYVRIKFEDNDNERYQYRFNMNLMSLNTSDSQLQKLSSEVTHIIRRETIIVDSKDERSDWVKKFDNFVPFVSAKPKSRKRKIEVRAEARPSVIDIKSIIEKNAKEGRKPTDWDNVGFVTDTSTVWVDRYRLRKQVNMAGKKDTLISAKELSEAILANRSEFIQPFKKVESNVQNKHLSGS
jgi:hypothetical protein